MTADARIAIPNNPTSDEALLNLVQSRFTHSENSYVTMKRKVANWYDLYRGWFRGRFQKWRNEVHLPLVFSTIQGDVARKQNTLYGQWPTIQHFGFGEEDAAAARKNDLLISAQLKDCQAYKKTYDFLCSADIYGTGVSVTSWLYDREFLEVREQNVTPITQRLVESVKTEEHVLFDGPNFEVWDILDSFPQPGVHDVDDMRWFILRSWLDLDDVRALEADNVFDEGTSRKIETGHLMNAMRAKMDDRFSYRRTPFEEGFTPQKEDFARPCEIWDMWGTVPSEFVPDDRGTIRVATVINGQVVARNRPTPYWHGRIPIEHYSPMRDPHYFFGPGKAEVAEKMQIAANKIACQKLDALDLFIDPMFYGNRMAGIDKRQAYTRPGGFIWGDLPPGEALQALVPDMSGMQNAYQEVNELWRMIQQGTGMIEDTVSGGPGGTKRQTAHEFHGRQENISIRLLLEARMLEETWLEPVCKKFRALNRQFLDVPQQLRMLGSNAVVNPVTGEPLPQDDMNISRDDLYLDYDVRAMGSTQVVSKFEKQQNLMGLLQSVGSHPAGMGMINWMAFFRQIFLAFDMPNTSELLNPPVNQLPMIQAGQMAGGGGGVPSAAGLEGGTDLGGMMEGQLAGAAPAG